MDISSTRIRGRRRRRPVGRFPRNARRRNRCRCSAQRRCVAWSNSRPAGVGITRRVSGVADLVEGIAPDRGLHHHARGRRRRASRPQAVHVVGPPPQIMHREGSTMPVAIALPGRDSQWREIAGKMVTTSIPQRAFPVSESVGVNRPPGGSISMTPSGQRHRRRHDRTDERHQLRTVAGFTDNNSPAAVCSTSATRPDVGGRRRCATPTSSWWS